jgi:hypothetical protein
VHNHLEAAHTLFSKLLAAIFIFGYQTQRQWN